MLDAHTLIRNAHTRLGIQPAAAGAVLPFEQYAARNFRILTKDNTLMPFRVNRIQRDLLSKLTGRDLIVKPRQVGISTVLQARHAYLEATRTVQTATLCHEDELTRKLRQMKDRLWQNMPADAQPVRKYANAVETTYPGNDSSAIIVTVGGQAGTKKGRGGTYSHIHGSEVAFWTDARAVLAAAMQAGNPDIALESTTNGAQGAFYEWSMEALDGAGVWTLHFYSWWWDDTYRLPLEPDEIITYSEEELALVSAHGLTPEQIKWRRQKQRELPHTFQQEYPEDVHTCFLLSGQSYFGDIEHVFTAPANAKPDPAHAYVAGLDFAQTTDYTVMVVIDTETRCMVDMLRINNLPWLDQRQRIISMAKKWHVNVVMAEANSIGSVNIEALRADDVPVEAFVTTAQSKPPLIQALHYGLHEDNLRVLNVPEIKRELRAFVAKQTTAGNWQYAAGEGAHDDIVMALALAWHATTGYVHWIPNFV